MFPPRVRQVGARRDALTDCLPYMRKEKLKWDHKYNPGTNCTFLTRGVLIPAAPLAGGPSLDVVGMWWGVVEMQ
ncbi:hypothetical protein E2C01_037413 [Portunus trituberculatus]|uniref:Uncharacterized protein n=1 Tax=Portunus trituberculatus TaxID=210409 RepID=A0A5B7F9A7_PORTR|nr:hypothetical protein [Portunus trituberculatus]